MAVQVHLLIVGYINVEDLSVGFESDLTGGCDPLTVIFTDSSSFPNPGKSD